MSGNKYLQIEKGKSQNPLSSDFACTVLCIISMAAVIALGEMLGI